jgi:hypothetical protein
MDNIRIILAQPVTELVEKLVELGCDRLLARESVESIFDRFNVVEGYGFIPYRFIRKRE